MRQARFAAFFISLALIAGAPLPAIADAEDDFKQGVDAHNAGKFTDAVAWFRKAAEQGNADAKLVLGLMYENGRGVPQSDAEAVSWYRKAAEQGDADAQNNLGFMYENGRGVPQNDVLAYAFSNLAAAQGVEGAVIARDRILKTLNKEQVAEGQMLASQWKVGSPLPTTTKP